MSNVFKRIVRFTNSSKHLITIELEIEKNDLEKLPLKSGCFNLTDTDTGYLHLNLSNHKCLYLILSEVAANEVIRRYTALVFNSEGSVIHSHETSRDKMHPKFDLLQEFYTYFDGYSDIKYPLKLIFYLETQNADCMTVEDVKNVETLKYTSEQVDCLRDLSLDFKKIHDQDIGTDVTLHVDGVNIKAHKTILRARSPVFNKMFEHDTSESANSVIYIKDISASIIKEFLDFLYTGIKKNHDFNVSRELYYVADKYEVLSLRYSSKEDLLSHHLQKDNACEMLILSDQHGDDLFKAEVLTFIKNNLKAVVETKSFEDLSENYPKLALAMMRKHVLET